jgi:hypothetical protein
MNLKIVILITGGRTGSDFFQSLTDGHKEILQFPGCFFYNDFWQKTASNLNVNEISDAFISEYPHFFNSGLNTLERHHMLGENKNDSFIVNHDRFIKVFSDLMKGKQINKFSVFECLHESYYLACGLDITKKKLIVINLHDYRKLDFFKDFNYEVICFLRDPLINLTSGTLNRLLYKEDISISGNWFVFYLNRIFNGIEIVNSDNKKVFVIQLEHLHHNHYLVFNEFCKHYGIKYQTCLESSTYHGKRWWGDSLSRSFLSGVNPKFSNTFNKNIFYKKDIYFLEKALETQMKAYGYKKRSSSYYPNFYMLLPLKLEIRIWFRSLTKFQLFQFIKTPIYWIRRVQVMKKVTQSNIKPPYSFGTQSINKLNKN